MAPKTLAELNYLREAVIDFKTNSILLIPFPEKVIPLFHSLKMMIEGDLDKKCAAPFSCEQQATSKLLIKPHQPYTLKDVIAILEKCTLLNTTVQVKIISLSTDNLAFNNAPAPASKPPLELVIN